MAAGSFPATRYSIVGRIADDDPEVRARALDAFASAYRTPVARYIRFRWRLDAERADDLTQDFFARTLESQALARFDPARARFRTYVRLLVDGHVANVRKAEGRLKRGGHLDAVPLEERTAAGEVRSHEPAVTDDHDEVFYREWVRAVFEGAVDDVRTEATASGRQLQYEVFSRYDLAGVRGDTPPSYAEIAGTLGLTTAMVTNHLAAMRRRLRACVLARLRDATASDAEFEAEAKRMLGGRR